MTPLTNSPWQSQYAAPGICGCQQQPLCYPMPMFEGPGTSPDASPWPLPAPSTRPLAQLVQLQTGPWSICCAEALTRLHWLSQKDHGTPYRARDSLAPPLPTWHLAQIGRLLGLRSLAQRPWDCVPGTDSSASLAIRFRPAAGVPGRLRADAPDYHLKG